MKSNSIIEPTPTREPEDTDVRQQRVKAWNPILDPVYVILGFLGIGALFIPTGWKLRQISDNVKEYGLQYDGPDEDFDDDGSPCAIGVANEGRKCQISFNITEEMEAPIMVYYEIENFHQNHRIYSVSRDSAQLLGSLKQDRRIAKLCDPLNKLGDVIINPCGLIANTFFNDVFKIDLEYTNGNIEMIEDGIAWQSDLEYKFKQVDGYQEKICGDTCDDEACDCDIVDDDGKGAWSCKEPWFDEKENKCYLFSYPNDENTQYLYETYPDTISPREGVTNEHFVNWMRIASMPKFRKLYGVINTDLKVNDLLTFNVTANWEVQSFKGKKTLVITTASPFGGRNIQFGNSFLGVGSICVIAAAFFALKHLIKPRRLADKKFLKYNREDSNGNRPKME